jgi:hypothetical protein
LLVCPRSVMTEVVEALVRGSTSVMCRAAVPAARRGAPPARGIAQRERSGCEVESVLTTLLVVRSMVRTVWSCDTE